MEKMTRLFHTLTFRVIVGSSLLLVALFALYSYFVISFNTEQMSAQIADSANRVSDIIKQSTHYSMLLNRREDVFQIITTIGQEPGVDGIRIYNKRGEIMFSTDKAEEGRTVDMHAEACFACHNQAEPLKSLPAGNRVRTYIGQEGHRTIGLINPIRNEPACANAGCHAHPPERTVLGVLDVRMSLEKVDANMARARKKFLIYASGMILVISLASGLFLFVMVHRPVRRLMEGTRQVSSGNLEYRIADTGQDDIGALAQSFNQMTLSLQRAQKENENWAGTLEKRVEEKSLELQQIHDRMLHIEKMASLGKLSATVAHELNNPLEGILTYSKLIAKRMRKEPNPTEAARQTLEELDLIIREVLRCGNIVKNLLLFSKKQVGEFGLAQLNGIVEKAVQLMQHHFKISNVRFKQEYLTEDTTLRCDENQIQQALVALMVNATEAMRGGGDLSLGVERSGSGALVIHVSDTGAGIAAEDLPYVFEPFFTTKKGGQGVGLGLSVVYGIIERHGGQISVKSEPGKGTVFTLSFPPADHWHPDDKVSPGATSSPVAQA
jgi:two-component system, NtrC family, sensor kinase